MYSQPDFKLARLRTKLELKNQENERHYIDNILIEVVFQGGNVASLTHKLDLYQLNNPPM